MDADLIQNRIDLVDATYNATMSLVWMAQSQLTGIFTNKTATEKELEIHTQNMQELASDLKFLKEERDKLTQKLRDIVEQINDVNKFDEFSNMVNEIASDEYDKFMLINDSVVKGALNYKDDFDKIYLK